MLSYSIGILNFKILWLDPVKLLPYFSISIQKLRKRLIKQLSSTTKRFMVLKYIIELRLIIYYTKNVCIIFCIFISSFMKI